VPQNGPAKSTAGDIDAVAQVLALDPRTLGYSFSVWAVNKLWHHLGKEIGNF
jgi:hypothetical protein